MKDNLEKENKLGKNLDGPNANTPLKFLTVTSIIGDKVVNKTGDTLGEIKDIMLDLPHGTIEYVVIETGSFLGLGGKLFAIPYEALKISTKNKNFTLDVTKEFMEKAPGFDKNHWPETNGHYFNVTTHWGDFEGPSTGGM